MFRPALFPSRQDRWRLPRKRICPPGRRGRNSLNSKWRGAGWGPLERNKLFEQINTQPEAAARLWAEPESAHYVMAAAELPVSFPKLRRHFGVVIISLTVRGRDTIKDCYSVSTGYFRRPSLNQCIYFFSSWERRRFSPSADFFL